MTATLAAAIVTTPSDRQIHVERIVDAPRDRVWRAFTDPKLIAQWWGRGNPLTVERMEVQRGGHWRFVEHAPNGETHGFEGRYREVTPPSRLIRTFEWDGLPGHVIIESVTFEDLGNRTKLVFESLFHTTEERDGFLNSGMEAGMNESLAALDRLLARLEASQQR